MIRSRIWIRITVPFLWIGEFRRFISIYHTAPARRRKDDSATFWQHSGSDPADIRIRIQINLEIRIRIQDYFWLRLNAFAVVCALWVLSSCFCNDHCHVSWRFALSEYCPVAFVTITVAFHGWHKRNIRK